MYIELFLLDNVLMDMLICRLAAAICGRKLRLLRAAAFSIFGAVYAALAYIHVSLNSLLCKILMCIIMAFALPCGDVREYIAGLMGMLAAAFIIGGLAFFAVYATGGAVDGSFIGGITLRILLFTASAAAAMPSIARRLRQRRVAREQICTLTIVHKSKRYILSAMVDTGNSLIEPVSGLPVAVAHIPGERGDIPIPAATVQGGGVLMAFRPDRAEFMGMETDMLIALAETSICPEALIPPAALPDTFLTSL